MAKYTGKRLTFKTVATFNCAKDGEDYRLNNRVLDSANKPNSSLTQPTKSIGAIGCRSELGGLLKHYYRCAA